jgi:hypothetical protein
MGGRTCIESPDSGCLRCSQISQGCVGTPCAFAAAQVIDVQQSTSCDPSQIPNFTTWHCTGQWAVLDGGSRIPCTIQTVPTGAERWSVSCGSCMTIVTIGNR